MVSSAGKWLLKLPLVERKRLLELALDGAPAQVRLVDFLDGELDAVVDEVRRQNLEGVVAKRALSRCEPDQRSGAWVKFRCGFAQEFVVGGYTRGRGRAPLGALIVGYYDDDDRLRYAGKVGSGFSQPLVRDVVIGTAPDPPGLLPLRLHPRKRWHVLGLRPDGAGEEIGDLVQAAAGVPRPVYGMDQSRASAPPVL